MTDRIRTLFTRAFWLDTIERCVKAFASGALSVWAATDVAFTTIATAGGYAAGIMLLISVASAPVPAMSPASMVPPGA